MPVRAIKVEIFVDAEYWDDRVQTFGHTGWGSRVLYGVDQPIRLCVVQRAIEKFCYDLNTALDFGCGSGDFSLLCAHYFKVVESVDISKNVLMKARHKCAKFEKIKISLAADYEPIRSLDLILCVTVLQHITDDDVIEAQLKNFSERLTPGGKLIVLESFDRQKQGAPRAVRGYVNTRNFDNFVAQCERNGLNLVTCEEVLNIYSLSENRRFLHVSWIILSIAKQFGLKFYLRTANLIESFILKKTPLPQDNCKTINLRLAVFTKR